MPRSQGRSIDLAKRIWVSVSEAKLRHHSGEFDHLRLNHAAYTRAKFSPSVRVFEQRLEKFVIPLLLTGTLANSGIDDCGTCTGE